MKPSLFRPSQFATPPALVLVPYFSQNSLFTTLQKQAGRRQDLLHSSLLWFENMAVISGFIGYPHLLTLLGLVADLADKEVFFLGAAGALKPRFREPAALQVGEILSSSIFKRFSRAASLPLKRFTDRSFPVVRGVSVDVLQRETPAWLAEQQALKTDIVEMELFPLRCFLGRPFHALVVLSDRVEKKGISPFRAKAKFNSEFNRAFQAITRYINHEKSHPDPEV
ncbi:MAG: hypothetical protein L6428_16430 [Candidatus Aminicenantes bacterium]|nr:hypothetical protein [Acidobacteriota bacterium]MCG2813018.1 hypothetical protein [Candidatus Aminicenantes bacterium]